MKRLAIIAVMVLCACDDRPSQWDAFVYPNAANLSDYKAIKGFKTFELCQNAAIGELRSLPDPDAGDYECGFKCRFDPSLDVNVCKQTRK